MPVERDLVIKVARADVLAHMAFTHSLGRWQSPERTGFRWKEIPPPASEILIGDRDAIVVEGDCRVPVRAPDGGTIHIVGDVASELELGTHTEVIISGNVTPEATLSITGICHVFVGGSFYGCASSASSLKLWVEGELSGEILTGHPSTEVWVGCDFDGVIRPREMASLLWLSVNGFAHEDVITKIMEFRYTQFQACVGRSNVPKGLYPGADVYAQFASQRSYNRWCVYADP